MGPAIYHVNAFCGRGAAGNPGAICLLDDSHSPEWMQEVAAQMNLSETGFVQRLDTGDFALRWFSPRQEMPLCGHVTLGAAHVIWVEAQLSDQAVLRFETARGALHASRGADGIEIALPIDLCTDVTPPTWFRDVFAVEPKRALAGNRKYLIELASAAEVLGVRPNFDLLRRVADRGVILTARSASSGHDIVSRYFASYVGVDEDPATGSAHCCLVPYWSERLGKPLIRAWQASARGGNLIGRCIGDDVHLTGQARTVLAGELRL